MKTACEYCGKEVPANRRKFCSRECLYRGSQLKQQAKAAKQDDDEFVTVRFAGVCNVSYEPPISKRPVPIRFIGSEPFVPLSHFEAVVADFERRVT